MENYKQIKALEFVSCMEEFAMTKKMKQRVLDRIRELKNNLEKNLSELEVEQKVLEIDELANYITQQFFKENPSEFVIDEMTTVSMDEIKERIEQILQECHSSNESMKNSYVYNQQSYIVEAAQKMRDFSNIKANYEEVQSSRFFCERFEQIGMNLNRQIRTSLVQFTKIIFQNCDQATSKLKNMLAYIQDKRIHKRQREMYSIYDTRRSQIFQENQSRVNSIDCGGNLIGKFGKQHVAEVENIIEEQKKKTFFIKLLPILIIFAFIIVPKIGGWIGDQIKTIAEINRESVSEEKTPTEDVPNYELNDILDTVSKINTIKKEFENEGADSKENSIIGPIIVIAVIYFIYIKIVNKIYVKRVCNAVGLYMTSEIEKFLQENPLENLIAEAFRIQQEALETGYREIFEKLLNGKIMDNVETISEQDRFLKLREEWNDVKRLV